MVSYNDISKGNALCINRNININYIYYDTDVQRVQYYGKMIKYNIDTI